jgi:membrane protease YdiL (CAAX protease family)
VAQAGDDQPRVTAMTPAQARRSLAVYFLIVVLVSGFVEGWMILDGRPVDQLPVWCVPVLMWAPGLAGVLTRLVRREGFADLGLRLGGWRGLRWIGVVLLLPTVVGLAVYPIAWLTGLVDGPLPSSRFPDGSPWLAVGLRLLVVLPLGTAFGLLLATGEELGWRGTMLNRLVDARAPRPVLLSGVIWAAWHVPLILSGQYASGSSPVLSSALFVVTVVCASVVMARVQWHTGSVWTACVFHAAWNATIQGVFDRSTEMTDAAEIWVGESGLLVVGALLALAALFWRGRWQILRHPRDRAEPLPVAP